MIAGPHLDTAQVNKTTCAWQFAGEWPGLARCQMHAGFLLNANDGNGFAPVCRLHVPASLRWAFSLFPHMYETGRMTVLVKPNPD